MLKNKIFLFLFLSIVFSLIPILFLLQPGFPITDDGTWLIIRFSAFFETFRDGQIPVRFILRLNDGFGYPVSNFLYPLYLYLATPIHILGFNFLYSIKILLIINILLTSTFSFLWLHKRFDHLSAFLGSVVLVLSPYFLFDLFRRGSVGELLAISIVPFILWQIERKSFLLVSLGFALLIMSHNSLSALFIPLIIIYAFLSGVKLKEFFNSLLLGIGLSAFFWIPALIDLRYTNFTKIEISTFYNYLFSNKDYYLIGVSSLFVLIFSIYILFKNRNLRKERFLIFAILCSFFIIFLQLPISKTFWEIFPFKDFIQFPFRLLSVFVILISFLAAFTSYILKDRNKYLYSFAVIFLILVQAFYILKEIKFEVYPDTFYSTNQATTTVSDEYLTRWFKKPNEGSLGDRIIYVSGKGVVENQQINSRLITFNAISNTDSEIKINVMYFPGWRAYINGNEAVINYEENGLINLDLPEGTSDIEIKFEETRIRMLSNLVSIFFFMLLGFLAFKQFKNIRKTKMEKYK